MTTKDLSELRVLEFTNLRHQWAYSLIWDQEYQTDVFGCVSLVSSFVWNGAVVYYVELKQIDIEEVTKGLIMLDPKGLDPMQYLAYLWSTPDAVHTTIDESEWTPNLPMPDKTPAISSKLYGLISAIRPEIEESAAQVI